ncbi:MAG TPA: glycosyltransferase, partial [Ilumatobacter sp.]|nr:glycosyltransferase [Ilumatobacter sp.]
RRVGLDGARMTLTGNQSSTTAGKLAIVGAGAGVATIYVGLPLLLVVRGALRPRPWRASGPTPSRITVVIAAHNEEAAIAAKLGNLAEQSGEWELDVIVASDGSSDATVAIARDHATRPTVLDLERGGKAAALNAALNVAEGDVVVFSDANSRLEHDALEHLLAPFADPEVGGVAGDQRYSSGSTSTARGERDYWSYERTVKRLESATGSVVSSTGTLHAIRRDLIDHVPADVTDDFYLSTGVIARNRRLVFAPAAIAWEQPNDDASAEYRRRVRIISRGLTGVARRRELLDYRKHGWYSLVLFMHKICRRLVFLPMLAAAVGGWSVRKESGPWRVLTLGQVVFYGAAALGVVAPRHPMGRNRLASLTSHFCAANLAAAHAVLNVVRGKTFVTWEPERNEALVDQG